MKRKHHYVPRFYLGAFESFPKRIHLYNLKRSLEVRDASLRAQCYRRKFYGSDDDTENALAILEDWLSPALREVRNKGGLPPVGSDEHLALVIFVAMQMLRTPKSAERLSFMVDKVTKQIFSKAPELEGEDIRSMRIGFDNPVLVSLGNLGPLVSALLDLNLHLVVSARNSFLTSDNPVFKYNQWCEKIQWIGVTGAASRGFQIFAPLSPRHQLVLYDGGVYEVSAGKYSRCCGAKESDVDQLNVMQLVSALENIYFAGREQLQDIYRLLPKAEPLRIPDPSVVREYGQDDEPNSSLIHTYDRVENLGLNLSFLKLKEQALRVPLNDRAHQYRDVAEGLPPGTRGGKVVRFSQFIGGR